MEEHHLLLDQVNHVVNMLSVSIDELLFLLEDQLHQFLMVLADSLHICTILIFELGVSGDGEVSDFDHLGARVCLLLHELVRVRWLLRVGLRRLGHRLERILVMLRLL